MVRTSHEQSTRGAILLYAAILIAALMGFAALAIDSGFLFSVKHELHNAADSAALAAASGLPKNLGGAPEAVARAQQFSVANKAGERAVTLPASDVTVGYWDWDAPGWQASGPGGQKNAVRLKTSRTSGVNGQIDTWFARIMQPSFRTVEAQTDATGVVEPPNLVVGLDMRWEQPEFVEECNPPAEIQCGIRDLPGCPGMRVCWCTDPDVEQENECSTCVTPEEMRTLANRVINFHADPVQGQTQIPVPETGIAGVGYDEPKVVWSLTEDLAEVRRALGRAAITQGIRVDQRPLAFTLEGAINIVGNAPRGSKTAVLLYNLDMGGPPETTIAELRPQLDRAKQKGIRFFIVMVGKGENETNPDMVVRKDILQQVALDTGGQWYERRTSGLVTDSELKAIMRDIAERLPVRLVE